MSGKHIKFGRFEFPSIKAFNAELSRILNGYGLLQRVSDPEDEEVLREVLKMHPEFQEKTRRLAVVKFEVHPYVGGGRTFYFYRTDGSRDNFSIRKCVTNAARR